MSNLNIEYQYRSGNEILNDIKTLNEFSIMEIGILLFILIVLILKILYVFPGIRIFFELRKKDEEKLKKKLSLKQIIITKEIENEIENELKNEKK